MGEADKREIGRIDVVNSTVETGKNLLALLRDVAIFSLIAMLLFWPHILDKKLTEARLSSFEGFGLKVVREANKDSRAADTQVEQARDAAETARLKMAELLRDPRLDPHAKAQLGPVYNSILQWGHKLNVASE